MMVMIIAMVSKETDKERQRHGDAEYLQVLIIIIMEICKAPTPRLKALNKHNTRTVHRDGKCYPQFNKN